MQEPGSLQLLKPSYSYLLLSRAREVRVMMVPAAAARATGSCATAPLVSKIASRAYGIACFAEREPVDSDEQRDRPAECPTCASRLCGSLTKIRCRSMAGRSSVTPKKKRSAETALFMLDGCTPFCLCCS